MKRHCLIGAALLSAQPLSAWAQERFAFDVEPWHGSAVYSDSEDGYSHCLMAAQFDRQMSLVVALDRAGGVSLGVRNPRWALTLLEEQPLAFTLGGAQFREATAVAIDSTLLLVRFDDGDVVLDELVQAPTVTIAQENQNFQFVMVQGPAAVEALRDCNVAALIGVDIALTPDQAEAEGGADGPAVDGEHTILVDPVTLDQTAARNFLQAAGLNDFVLLTPAEMTDFLADARAAWTDGDIFGALYTVSPRSRRLSRAADQLMTVLSDGCEGDFTSSPTIDPIQDDAIERRSAACIEDDLGMLFRTTAINGESGTLIILQAALNDQSARLAAADDRLIAAIREGLVGIE